jgi:hypothetical protein
LISVVTPGGASPSSQFVPEHVTGGYLYSKAKDLGVKEADFFRFLSHNVNEVEKASGYVSTFGILEGASMELTFRAALNHESNRQIWRRVDAACNFKPGSLEIYAHCLEGAGRGVVYAHFLKNAGEMVREEMDHPCSGQDDYEHMARNVTVEHLTKTIDFCNVADTTEKRYACASGAYAVFFTTKYYLGFFGEGRVNHARTTSEVRREGILAYIAGVCTHVDRFHAACYSWGYRFLDGPFLLDHNMLTHDGTDACSELIEDGEISAEHHKGCIWGLTQNVWPTFDVYRHNKRYQKYKSQLKSGNSRAQLEVDQMNTIYRLCNRHVPMDIAHFGDDSGMTPEVQASIGKKDDGGSRYLTCIAAAVSQIAKSGSRGYQYGTSACQMIGEGKSAPVTYETQMDRLAPVPKELREKAKHLCYDMLNARHAYEHEFTLEKYKQVTKDISGANKCAVNPTKGCLPLFRTDLLIGKK